jgi:hypothetical protein
LDAIGTTADGRHLGKRIEVRAGAEEEGGKRTSEKKLLPMDGMPEKMGRYNNQVIVGKQGMLLNFL